MRVDNPVQAIYRDKVASLYSPDLKGAVGQQVKVNQGDKRRCSCRPGSFDVDILCLCTKLESSSPSV